MAMEVVKVDLKTVQDASTLDAGIRNEQFSADQVIAVIGKTEGNGLHSRRPGLPPHAHEKWPSLEAGGRADSDGVVGRLRRGYYAPRHDLYTDILDCQS
jgi:amidohydrolase ring-opening protein AtzD/TrzD